MPYRQKRRNHAAGIADSSRHPSKCTLQGKADRPQGSARSTTLVIPLQAAGREMIAGGVPPARTAPPPAHLAVLAAGLHQAGAGRSSKTLNQADINR